MAHIGFKNELIFHHYLDDTAIKIINLGYGTFVWIQYGPNEGSSCDVEVMKQYDEEEVRKMVEHLQPYSKDIDALELFDKFLKTTTT